MLHRANDQARWHSQQISVTPLQRDQLSLTVSALVNRARKDIDTATLEARAVQQFGGTIQLGVVALSLISSVLIVWLYVGQNLIHRLMQLSSGMLAIAAGRQHTPIGRAAGTRQHSSRDVRQYGPWCRHV